MKLHCFLFFFYLRSLSLTHTPSAYTHASISIDTAQSLLLSSIFALLLSHVSHHVFPVAFIYLSYQIVPEFFRHFWIRRMALDRRNYKQLVETTVELAHKIGGADIIQRVVEDLKDESEPYRKARIRIIASIDHSLLGVFFLFLLSLAAFLSLPFSHAVRANSMTKFPDFVRYCVRSFGRYSS